MKNRYLLIIASVILIFAPLAGVQGQESTGLSLVKKPRIILQNIVGAYSEFNPTTARKIKQILIGNPPLAGLQRPGALHAGKSRLYIADLATGVVHVWSLEGEGEFTLTGKGKETLQSPVALAEDPQGRIWVADSGDKKVKVFNQRGRFSFAFTPADEGFSPGGLALDGAGSRVWVSDVKHNKIITLDFNGKVLNSFGRSGMGEGEFNRPGALLYQQGQLYVVDTFNFRIQVFDGQGKFIRQVGGGAGDSAGSFGRPKGVVLDRENRLWVGDALLGRVNIFSPEGGALAAFGGRQSNWPIAHLAGMTQNGQDTVYISDSLRGKIWVFKLEY